MTIAVRPVSYAPPPTPKPSTTIRTGRGDSYGTLKTRKWHWSTFHWRSPPDGQRMTRQCWRVRPTEQTRTERRQRGVKERGNGQTAMGKEPGRILEGGRRGGGDQNHHWTGENSQLNLEGQSIEIYQAAVRGLVQTPPSNE